MTQAQLSRFEELKLMVKLFLTAEEIAPVLECNPNDIRGAAKERPDLLGFPVTVYGSRTKIPRLPFIKFIEDLPNKCSRECELKGVFAESIESEANQWKRKQ